MLGEGVRVGVVVPAFNEAAHIEAVVSGIPEFVDRIIVVDDGSVDATAELVGQLCRTMGPRLRLVSHETNLGVGAAIRTGYRAALGDGLDVVAVMGGDGQMDPDDLARLVLPVARGLCDYAKGNRFTARTRPAGMPLHRYLAIRPLATLTSLASGIRTLCDPQSGYTAISFECLKELPLDLLHPGYGYPNHLLILLGAEGKRVVEVPVRAIYGPGDQSGIRPWKVAPALLALLARGYLWRLRAGRARTEQPGLPGVIASSD